MLKITRQVTLLLLAGALSFPAYSYATQATEVLVPEVTQEKVTGTVEDALGPVIGASVMVKGTTNGVITDLEGKFSLNDVKKGDIIVISYIGYVTQEIPYTGKPIQVKLARRQQGFGRSGGSRLCHRKKSQPDRSSVGRRW